MRQVKILVATNPDVLEEDLNEELKRLNSVEGLTILDIKYTNSNGQYTAMIEFKQEEKKILFEQDITETDKLINLKEE